MYTLILLLFCNQLKEITLSKDIYQIEYIQQKDIHYYNKDIPEKNRDKFKKFVIEKLRKKEILYHCAKSEVEFDINRYNKEIEQFKMVYNTEKLDKISTITKIPKYILEKMVKRDVYISTFLERKLFKDIKISQKEIKNYYFNHLDQFYKDKQIELYHIFSRSTKKIEKVDQLLKDGSTFLEVAYQYSELPNREKGGYMGWVTLKELPDMFKKAFKMRKGRKSKVIQSKIGYHIFFVKDIRKEGYLTFEESKQRIEAQLISVKQEKILNNFLKKKLSKIKISY